MKIRFQADADLHGPIVRGLIRLDPLIDFKTSREARLQGLDDRAVLAIAADDGRMLVTHDVSTMPEHFRRFIETRTSPGTVMVPQSLPYHGAIEGLLRLWATTEAERWENVLFYLPR
ncbi:MAG: DUF5615 family PIN-like protein [Blastocatellales bacterium]